MFKIFCDETWTSKSEFKNIKIPYIVFYGIMLDEANEKPLLEKIDTII
jgi:hypothetical protein